MRGWEGRGLAGQGGESLRRVLPREKKSVMRMEATSPTLLNQGWLKSRRKGVGLECADESEGGREDASLVEREHQCRLTVSWHVAFI